MVAAWALGRITCASDVFVGANNLIMRIGFGLRRFTNYRIRVLPYAGKPNWGLPATVTPR